MSATLGLAIFLVCLVLAPAASALPPNPTPTYPPPPNPIVIIDNTNPSVGDRVVVVGEGWCPGTEVTIYFNGVEVGTATVGADGTFSATISVPDGTPPGPAEITVVGTGSSCQGTDTVTRTIYVSAHGGGGGGQAGGGGVDGQAGGQGGQGGHALPFTGSNVSLGVLILFALVAVGVVSLVAGRRRDARATD